MNPSDFPYEYVGGGYFRLKGVPKGEPAPILHGMQAIVEFDRLQKEAAAEKPYYSSYDHHKLLKENRPSLRARLKRSKKFLAKKCSNSRDEASKRRFLLRARRHLTCLMLLSSICRADRQTNRDYYLAYREMGRTES